MSSPKIGDNRRPRKDIILGDREQSVSVPPIHWYHKSFFRRGVNTSNERASYDQECINYIIVASGSRDLLKKMLSRTDIRALHGLPHCQVFPSPPGLTTRFIRLLHSAQTTKQKQNTRPNHNLPSPLSASTSFRISTSRYKVINQNIIYSTKTYKEKRNTILNEN